MPSTLAAWPTVGTMNDIIPQRTVIAFGSNHSGVIMSRQNISRRTFLQSAAAGSALAGAGNLGFLAQVPRVGAEESELDPKVVRLDPEIEPVVRLLEETPREQLLEKV